MLDDIAAILQTFGRVNSDLPYVQWLVNVSGWSMNFSSVASLYVFEYRWAFEPTWDFFQTKTKIHIPKSPPKMLKNLRLQSLIERPLDEDFVRWEEDYF